MAKARKELTVETKVNIVSLTDPLSPSPRLSWFSKTNTSPLLVSGRTKMGLIYSSTALFFPWSKIQLPSVSGTLHGGQLSLEARVLGWGRARVDVRSLGLESHRHMNFKKLCSFAGVCVGGVGRERDLTRLRYTASGFLTSTSEVFLTLTQYKKHELVAIKRRPPPPFPPLR